MFAVQTNYQVGANGNELEIRGLRGEDMDTVTTEAYKLIADQTSFEAKRKQVSSLTLL